MVASFSGLDLLNEKFSSLVDYSLLLFAVVTEAINLRRMEPH